MVLGARQQDFSRCDVSLKVSESFNEEQAAAKGFPLKYTSGGFTVRFLPWDERKTKKELETATRRQFQEHKNRVSALPYGFTLDMQIDQNRYALMNSVFLVSQEN